jgi:acyl-CoA synthetase (AMP-forming)/AMP-acid ligase II
MAKEGADRPLVLPDVLRRQAEKLGDQPALVVDRGAGSTVGPQDGHGAMTFAEWNRKSDRVARALVDAGLQRGDRVALAFQNRDADRFAVSYFGAIKAGGVAVPVGVRLAESEIGHILRHAEPRIAIAGEALATAIGQLSIPNLEVWGPQAYNRAVDHDVAPPEVEIAPEDLCDILYTSGTTGTPKGVASTHANLVAIRSGGLKPFAGRAFVHGVPVYTFAGTHAMQIVPLRAGMRVVVMHRFDGERYLRLIEAHRATVSYAVPSMLKLAIEAFDAAASKPDTSSLTVLMYGAAPMPPSTLEVLPRIAPRAFLVNLYAFTESGNAACAMPPGEAANHPGSVGVPVPPTEVRIAIVEGSGSVRDAKPGEVGEIWLRGEGGARSYYKDADASARTFLPDGWVRSNDLGHVDTEGYLYLDGRVHDVVNRGGFKIFVNEIDALLEAHPAVREAAVIGVPHPVLGEDLAAFVALKPGAHADAEALRSYLSERLADYKVPRSFTFVDKLPRSTMGKVIRRELRRGEP